MRYSFFGSIRMHFIILVLISIMPALFIILYSGIDRRDHEIELAKENVLTTLRGLEQYQYITVEGARQFLKTLANLPDVQSLNGKRLNALLSEILKEAPLFSGIFVLNKDGVLAAASSPFVPQSLKHRKYFQDVLRRKSFSVGEYVVGIVTKRPVLHFSYPIIDEKNALKGVICVALDLSKYSKIFKNEELPEGYIFEIFDHRNVYLYRQPDMQGYLEKMDSPYLAKHMSSHRDEGTFVEFGADGTRYFYAFKKFYLNGNDDKPYLSMRIAISYEKVMKKASKVLYINIGLFLLAFMIAFSSAWFIGNIMISRRLIRLVDASKLLGKGDLSIRTGLPYRKDELGVLAKAFDEMAERLELKEKERDEAEKLLKESEERYRSLAEDSTVGVYLVQKNLFRYVNKAFARMHGYTPEEMVDRFGPKDFTVPEDIQIIDESTKRIIEGEVKGSNLGIRIRRRDGVIRYVEAYVALCMYKGKRAILGTFLDMTERKELEEKLHMMTIIDELTGLYNRRGFITLAQQQLKVSERIGRGMVLFFADIDNMKWINDTFGHNEGDRALIDTASILKKAFRESDIIGRMGGDEFAILAIDTKDETKDTLKHRLQSILQKHNMEDHGRYTLSISIGSAYFDYRKPISLEELIYIADCAMYEEKKHKRSV